MSSEPAPSRSRRAFDALGWLVTAVAAWVWFCTLAARASDKVRTLRTIENYALAVHDQLIWNYAFTGEWKQTIHFGYDNTWTWSGHHSLWLFVVAQAYRFAPGPLTLCWIQIGLVALGAFAAHALGRVAIGGWLGGLVGTAVYLAYPPLQAVALNDYQDLILGTPWALAALAANRHGSRVAFALCAIAAAFTREEWVVVVAMIPFTTPGGWRKKLREGAIGLGILAPYVIFLALHRVKSTGHDTPMFSQIASMLTWPPPFTRTWVDVENFYRVLFATTQLLAFAAPLTFLMAVPALLFHATADARGGVDATWLGHIHHMAPIAALLCGATIEGIGALWKLGRGRPVWMRGVGALLVAGLVAWNSQCLGPVIRANQLREAYTLAPRTTPPDAPEWALVAQAPADASICTDVVGSILVSSRERSYTYDESLRDKEPQRDLRACDWILVRKSHTDWWRRAKEARASEKVGETAEYVFYHLPWP